MFESSKFDKSGGHIRPGPDLAGFEKTAGFRPRPDMISGATLQCTSCKLFITPYINNSMLSKKNYTIVASFYFVHPSPNLNTTGRK